MEILELPGVGAEITGVDLRRLTEHQFENIRTVYSEHGVIFFRDQELSEEDHIRFAESWASINVNRFFAAHPNYPQIAMVVKEKDQKDNIGGGWHTDHSYDAEPAMGSILVARELPQFGGDTFFASMYRAYDALSDDMKSRLKGLRALHSAHHIFGTDKSTYYNTTDAGGNRIGNAAAADTLEDASHPIVITHPLSGKKALYVNPAFTIRVDGLPEEESAELLSTLYAHAMQKKFAYRFKWQPGSVAFWDNRATWHWALNDYHGQRRLMHRITLEGCALH